MNTFLVAARHADGSRNLYSVSDVIDYLDAQIFIKQETKAPTVLVGLNGGKSVQAAPIIEDQEQIA